MDLMPFPLFFMVCLLSCYASIIGKAAVTIDSNTWPETCKGQVYCDVKPDDYPSDEFLTQLYNMHKDLAPKMNETTPRLGDKCRAFNCVVEKIYMIKDDKNNIRYALCIPSFSHTVKVITCKANPFDDPLLENVQCQQLYSQYSFLVLTRDLKGLEIAKSGKIPQGCQSIMYDYEE